MFKSASENDAAELIDERNGVTNIGAAYSQVQDKLAKFNQARRSTLKSFSFLNMLKTDDFITLVHKPRELEFPFLVKFFRVFFNTYLPVGPTDFLKFYKHIDDTTLMGSEPFKIFFFVYTYNVANCCLRKINVLAFFTQIFLTDT